MRTRTRGTLTVPEARATLTNHACIAGVTYGSYQSTCKVGDIQTTRDVVTPNYSKLRRRGDVIINPFVGIREIGTSSISGPGYAITNICGSTPLTASYVFGDNQMARYSGVNQDFELFTDQEIDDFKELCSTQCWANVHREELQILVFLAELKRTISMLSNPLANFQRFFLKARNAKNSSKRASDLSLTTAQYIAREWLTYRYGWSQLYRDVYNVLQALEKKEVTGLLRSFGNVTRERQQLSTPTNTTFSSVVSISFALVQTHIIRVRAGVYYMGSRSTNDYLGFTPEHVVDAFWELIPYSFVVDWALGVQSYLKGLIRSLSVPIKGGFVTTTSEKIAVSSCLGVALKPGASEAGWSVIQNASGNCTWSLREKSRVPGIKPPRLKLDLRIRDILDVRVLDSLALILNLGSRK